MKQLIGENQKIPWTLEYNVLHPLLLRTTTTVPRVQRSLNRLHRARKRNIYEMKQVKWNADNSFHGEEAYFPISQIMGCPRD